MTDHHQHNTYSALTITDSQLVTFQKPSVSQEEEHRKRSDDSGISSPPTSKPLPSFQSIWESESKQLIENKQRVMLELLSKIKVDRSKSQSDEKKSIPQSKFRKTDQHISVKEPKRPPYYRSSTLLSNFASNKQQLISTVGEINEDIDKDENKSGKGEEKSLPKRPPLSKKSKSSLSFLSKVSTKVTSSFSTRKPRSTKMNKHHKTYNDNLSDSESYETPKMLSRFSKSLDELDDYDIVQTESFKSRQPGLARLDVTQSDEDANDVPLYEVCNFELSNHIVDEDNIIYDQFSLSTSLDFPDTQRNVSVEQPITSESKPYRGPSRDKPVTTPRPNVLKKHTQPSPKGPMPYILPSAKNNQEMAEKVIQEIMAKDPNAVKTEIVVQTSNYVAKYCDENGGFLEVGSKTVTLFIPPFAIDEKSSEEYPVLIYVHIEYSYDFTGRGEESQIAPVLHFGTPGTTFNYPVIVNVPTSVQQANHLVVTGLRKEDSDDSKTDWHETTRDEGKVVSVENGRCTMMLNHFTRDTVAARPKENKHFAQIKCVAFTSSVLNENNIFDIRVWMSSNADILKQDEKREIEENHAKRLVVFSPTLYLFKDGGDLNVEVVNMNKEWCPAYPNSDMREKKSLEKLLYDHGADGIRESHVFYIRPSGIFRPNKEVRFDIVLFQANKKAHGVKLQVGVFPEKKQENVIPGQRQPYCAYRQRPNWKPSKQSLEELQRRLSKNDYWKSIAAWFHMDVKVLGSCPSPVSGMFSMLFSKHAGTSDFMRNAIYDLKEPLDKLPDLQDAKDIVNNMLSTTVVQELEETVIRQPEQVSWPPLNPHTAIEVNNYRYIEMPREYMTLRSVEPNEGHAAHGASAATSSPEGAAYHQLESNDLAPLPLLHSSTRDRAYDVSRRLHCPVQVQWPPEAENDQRGGHTAARDSAGNESYMVPRGLDFRNSSAYDTILPEIDPNRPKQELPNIPANDYDYLNTVASDENIFANDNQAYVGMATSEPTGALPIEHVEYSEPPYANTIQMKKQSSGGYLRGILNSKRQHPVTDED